MCRSMWRGPSKHDAIVSILESHMRYTPPIGRLGRVTPVLSKWRCQILNEMPKHGVGGDIILANYLRLVWAEILFSEAKLAIECVLIFA